MTESKLNTLLISLCSVFLACLLQWLFFLRDIPKEGAIERQIQEVQGTVNEVKKDVKALSETVNTVSYKLGQVEARIDERGKMEPKP